MKKKLYSLLLILLVVVLTFSLVACQQFSPDKDYLSKVSKWSFWENEVTQSIKQKSIYDIANEHMKAGEVEGYQGQDKKVLIIGMDGTRADAMINVFRDNSVKTDSPNKGTENLHNTNAEFSALNELSEAGGLYHSYTGGEFKGKTQHTSTAPGWATMLTGTWASDDGGHGVVDNGETYQLKKDTIMLEYAKKGYSTSFNAGWSPHFLSQYKNEIAYLAAHPEYDMTYKQSNKPDMFSDKVTRDSLISNIDEGRDIIFGIIESVDNNGHNANFDNSNPHYVNSVRSSDNYAYQVLQHLKSSPNYANEDWLILMTTDHGGLNLGHGGQSLEERNIWIACNKKIDSKYYSKNYTGYAV